MNFANSKDVTRLKDNKFFQTYKHPVPTIDQSLVPEKLTSETRLSKSEGLRLSKAALDSQLLILALNYSTIFPLALSSVRTWVHSNPLQKAAISRSNNYLCFFLDPYHRS